MLRIELQLSNIWYLVWNLGCGFAQNLVELFLFRFLAGISRSAPLALGGGAISDIWSVDERGKSMGIYTLAPLLGPVVGPIAGGFIAEYATWRWVFWSSSVAAVFIQAIDLIWLRESHPGTLLRRKRDCLVEATGNHKLHTRNVERESLVRKLSRALKRPFRMFTTQPIIMVIAIYMAYLFGTLYLMLGTFPSGIRTKWYGESVSIGGLNYLSITIGSFAGLILNIFFIDRIYRNFKTKNNGIGQPKFQMLTMFVRSVMVSVGLF